MLLPTPDQLAKLLTRSHAVRLQLTTPTVDGNEPRLALINPPTGFLAGIQSQKTLASSVALRNIRLPHLYESVFLFG